LGEEKANFLLALGAMKKSGDFPWLPSSASFPAPSRPPAPYSSTSPSSSTWPPVLPEVRNPQLRQQAFTHRSWILGEAASAPGVENMHYERLEFLGDAYLQSISSHLLYDRFPSGREGLLSEMRQGIVANKALINYAQVYDMPNLLREGKGQGNAKMNGSKTIADCFEAYIGAVILDADTWDHGVKKVKDWLTALFEPKLREMEESRKNMVPVDKMAKNKLNAIAGGNRASIDYKWTDGGGGNKGGFWITVYLTGWGFNERMLGKGWGSSKSYVPCR
jgi:ribonuclease-3